MTARAVLTQAAIARAIRAAEACGGGNEAAHMRWAAARIAELEAALLSIACNTCCGPCQEAAAVARAALGKEAGE